MRPASIDRSGPTTDRDVDSVEPASDNAWKRLAIDVGSIGPVGKASDDHPEQGVPWRYGRLRERFFVDRHFATGTGPVTIHMGDRKRHGRNAAGDDAFRNAQ